MVLGVILFMGKISGAHLNPAVSVAFSLRGDFPWRRVPGYIVAQLAGASLAAWFLQAAVHVSSSYGSNYPAQGFTAFNAFAMESMLTFGLVSVILGTASGAQNLGVIGALGVGGYIALAGLWGSPISGASMNPARTFGPDAISANFTSYWVYAAGPLLGAVVAVGVAFVLRGRGGGWPDRAPRKVHCSPTWSAPTRPRAHTHLVRPGLPPCRIRLVTRAQTRRAAMMTDQAENDLVIERTLDAPTDLIWQMWTDPEHFASWYGPDGATIPVARMDVRVGGRRLLCMEVMTPRGAMQMWFAGEYLEVVENKRLVYTDAMSDESGNLLSPEQAGMPAGHLDGNRGSRRTGDLGAGTRNGTHPRRHPPRAHRALSAGRWPSTSSTAFTARLLPGPRGRHHALPDRVPRQTDIPQVAGARPATRTTPSSRGPAYEYALDLSVGQARPRWASASSCSPPLLGAGPGAHGGTLAIRSVSPGVGRTAGRGRPAAARS